jgi:hypothetical protein
MPPEAYAAQRIAAMNFGQMLLAKECMSAVLATEWSWLVQGSLNES